MCRLLNTLFFFLIILVSKSFAGDDPCSATFLPTNMSSPSGQTTNGLTDSGIDAPPYGDYQGSDFWASFNMPSGSLYIDFEDQGIGDLAIGIYEGTCDNPKLLYNVTDSNCDAESTPKIEITELTPGDTYFIRVWGEGGSTGGFDILLRESISPIVGFDVFDDATINGDCIDLTTNQSTQNGCAWYQELIDFSMPFTHVMQANFGNVDANGADGICLVYQSNGPNYCGASGGGIGALGMPNSAIFEFDTYQNGGYGDPAQDHCAFNVNGDINHATNIEGPVVLGNIEDGNLHDIEFSWDPSNNGYQLSFDGNVILSGSYDIINNCFGGNSMAYWGFTSATGGFSNLHTICPINAEELHGYQTYEEETICYGDEYRGQTTSGFYIDFEPMDNGCLKQINFLLEVLPPPIPTEIDTLICEGESIFVAGQSYEYEGFYPIVLPGANCDSLINLNLTVVNPSVVISQTGELDCFGNLVILEANLDTQVDYESIVYTWSGQGISGSSESVSISSPGIYELQVLVFYEGDFFCFTSDIIEIEPAADAPSFDGPEDVEISCEESDPIYLYLTNEDSSHEVAWYFDGELIQEVDSVLATEIGEYTVIVTDPSTGCSSNATLEVIQVGEVPTFDVSGGSLDCKNQQTELIVNPDKEYSSYTWVFNNDTISINDTVSVTQAGTYQVVVSDSTGCSSKKSFLVEASLTKPEINIDDKVGDCGATQVLLQSNVHDSLGLYWYNDVDTFGILNSVILNKEGTYYASVVDSTNGCQTIDTFTVDFKGAYPDILFQGNPIECETLEAELVSSTSLDNCTFEWLFMDAIVGMTPTYNATEKGTYKLVITSENGCSSVKEWTVTENLELPSTTLEQTELECQPNYAELNTGLGMNITSSYWKLPDESIIEDQSFLTNQEGWHYLIMKNGLCEDVDSIYVQKGTSYPDFEIHDMYLDCSTDMLPLDFNITSDFLGIEWDGPEGFTSNTEQPSIQDTGIYHLFIDVEGTCDVDTFLHVVGDFQKPEVDVTFNDIDCIKNTSKLSITTTSSEDSIVILLPDMSTSEYEGSDFESNMSGQYIIQTFGTNGCLAEDTIQVEAYLDKPTFDIELEDSLTCNTSSVDISIVTIEDNLEFNWSGPNSFSSNNPIIEGQNKGFYVVEVMNEFGCVSIDSVEVVENKTLPILSLEGSDLDCSVPSSFLEAYSNNEEDIIVWKSADGDTEEGENWEISSGGWYYAEVTNELGCKALDSIFINENKKAPSITLLSPDDVELLQGTTTLIKTELNTQGKPIISWFPKDGLSCTDCVSPEVLSEEDQLYTMIVTDENGCMDSITVKVRVRYSDKIYVPNIMTLNGLSTNGYFTLFGNENISNIAKMLIFDRWGNKVFDKENFLPNEPKLGWNGRFKGNKVSLGVYTYVINYENVEGIKSQVTGTVTLIR